MENNALQYVKNMLDKATQKGAFTLDETANIVKALENIYEFINKEKLEDHGKEEN